MIFIGLRNMKYPTKHPLLLSLLLLMTVSAHAQKSDDDGVTLSEPSWLDNNHLGKQRTMIDDIARGTFGEQIRGNKSDIATMQRIVYQGLVKDQDKIKLQAMGVVLGDIYVNELGLKWTIYEDRRGRSRAVCVVNTKYCLFPVTMLARRMEVGLVPDIQRIYDENADAIKAYLPKNPYDVSSHQKK